MPTHLQVVTVLAAVCVKAVGVVKAHVAVCVKAVRVVKAHVAVCVKVAMDLAKAHVLAIN